MICRSLSNGIGAIGIGIFSRVDPSSKRERQKWTFRLGWRAEFYDAVRSSILVAISPRDVIRRGEAFDDRW